MEFDNFTTERLWEVLDELSFIAGAYEHGSDEFEFLMEICGEIEDALKWG